MAQVPPSLTSRYATGYPTARRPALDDRPMPLRTATFLTEKVMAIPPVFKAAAADARRTMEERGEGLGVSWPQAVAEYGARRSAGEWEDLLVRYTDASVAMPDYFELSFHAYEKGNLTWDAAFEADSAAVTVHAPVLDESLDPKGDELMRKRFFEAAEQLTRAMGGDVREGVAVDAVDVGCSTGRSSAMLRTALGNGARVTGVDLSPFFLAVAYSNQELGRGLFGSASSEHAEPVRFVHGAGEALPLEDGTQDVVCITLTMHELPAPVSCALMREAHRVLRPGGFLWIAEMDPTSSFFQKIASIPPAWAAFRSTEPWLASYASLDVSAAVLASGFADVKDTACTPRHRAWVGRK